MTKYGVRDGILTCLCLLSLPVQGAWDPDRYIDINDVRPGMKAYCLTVYQDTTIERFSLDVVNVIHNVIPGRSAILVMGKDERFLHSGVVAGCSGSPVYIDDRLAGALAFGWSFSKDPLYGVTPIRDMLSIGQASQFFDQQDQHQIDTTDHPTSVSGAKLRGFQWDFSKPIDFSEIQTQREAARQRTHDHKAGLSPMSIPLLVSGIPHHQIESLDRLFASYGFMAVPSIAGTPDHVVPTSLAPGAALLVPLIDGDFKIAVLGTVTDVDDDRVYAFGHPFLGFGAVELPMATGQVYTVVSNIARSFKVGTPIKVVGALTADEPTGVLGRMGAQARTLPVTIRMDHYQSLQPRTFQCQLAYDRVLTPDLFKALLGVTVGFFGKIPVNHTLAYTVSFELENAPRLHYSNLSTQVSLTDILTEGLATVLLLLSNPYEQVDLTSIQMDIRLSADNRLSHISMIDLSDTRIKRGESVRVGVILETFQAQKRRWEFDVAIPEDLKPGKYALTVCGSRDYAKFIQRKSPHRLLALDRRSLLEALDFALNLKRGRLYCLLELPPSGVAMERTELPDLPASKVLVLQHANRTVHMQPLQTWLEQYVTVDTVTVNKETVRLIVEK